MRQSTETRIRALVGQIEECHISNQAEVELPEWRPRKPKYAKVATTPSAGGFAIADDGGDSD